MKKITIVCLLAAAGIISACQKPDLPHKKCQLITFIDSSATFGRVYHHMYNNERLMDSFTLGSTFSPAIFLRIGLDYNNQRRPILAIINNLNYYRYIYEQGRVVRIEEGGPDGQYHPWMNFVYDSRGRIIERTGAIEALRWEYIGNTNNFKRRIVFDPNNPSAPGLVYEYTYDNKVNPFTTWPNMTLHPFFQPNDDIYQVFEPIPDNNITYQGVTGLSDGSPFTFRETFYTYTYDQEYPVHRSVRYLDHVPFPGQTQETKGSGHYTYQCAGDVH